jgi:hypothetical protein
MSCLSATLSTTNTTLTGLGSNPGLRDDTPSTDRLSHGRHYPHFCIDSHFCVFHCLPFCAEYTNKTPIPVAQRSKARSLGHGCVVCCQAEICVTGRSFVERSFTEYCHCVWSRYLTNEAVLVRDGLSRREGGGVSAEGNRKKSLLNREATRIFWKLPAVTRKEEQSRPRVNISSGSSRLWKSCFILTVFLWCLY